MKKTDYTSIGETLYESTLSNGLKISVVTKPGFARCYALFATNYGGADRRFCLGGEFIDTPSGVAHFLEHKMFDMPEGDNALAVLAANGASPNAFTSSAMTAYYFESTSNFFENLETLLKFVTTPYFTPESVEKEQGIIAQEIRMIEDTPDYVVYDELMRALYAHNPIRDTVAGTISSIAEISDKTLYDCHKVFYAPSNMTLCVVGDVSPDEVEQAAKRLVTGEMAEAAIRDYGEAESLLPLKTRFTRQMEVSAPQFIIGAKLAPETQGDAILRQKIIGGMALHYLLGHSSPFYIRLYADGFLNTDFSADMDYAAETLTIMLGGESCNPEHVFSEFCAEVQNVKENGLDTELWSRSKKSSYGGRVRALSSFSGLCISMAQSHFSGYRALDSFEVAKSVTPEQVRDFIIENLATERLAMSIVEPERFGEDVNSLGV